MFSPFLLGGSFSLLFSLSVLAQTANLKDPVVIEKGRKVYMNNCLQCHNKDPNLKGSLGPSQVDAPYEVVKVKIITGRYPEKLPAGYKPQRTTKAMRKFPQLEKDVDAIYAWLQFMKKKK